MPIPRNTRGLKACPKSVVEFTRKWIQPKHLAYLKRWQKKFDLTDMAFALLAKPETKKVPLASIQPIGWHVYRIWLTPRTLTDGNDWRDSIVHELLHALLIKHYWQRRRFSRRGEEMFIARLSVLLSRK